MRSHHPPTSASTAPLFTDSSPPTPRRTTASKERDLGVSLGSKTFLPPTAASANGPAHGRLPCQTVAPSGTSWAIRGAQSEKRSSIIGSPAPMHGEEGAISFSAANSTSRNSFPSSHVDRIREGIYCKCCSSSSPTIQPTGSAVCRSTSRFAANSGSRKGNSMRPVVSANVVAQRRAL